MHLIILRHCDLDSSDLIPRLKIDSGWLSSTNLVEVGTQLYIISRCFVSGPSAERATLWRQFWVLLPASIPDQVPYYIPEQMEEHL